MNWAKALTRDEVFENIAQYRDEPEFLVWRDSYLEQAVANLDVEFVDLMLKSGAGPDVFASYGDSLQHSLAHMYLANRLAKGELILKVLDLVLSHGADPNHVGCNDWRAVDYAIEWKLPLLVDAFVKHGANPQQREFV